MTPRLDEAENAQSPLDAASVQQRLEVIEGSLLAQLTDEQRYGSGVPGQEQSSDLEFIQMTGLTRPFAVSAVPRQPAPTVAAPVPDLEERSPVDFFERGVVDVDHLAGPPGLEPVRPARMSAAVPAASESEPVAGVTATSADALRDLIADLTRSGGDEAPAAALHSEGFEFASPTIDAPGPDSISGEIMAEVENAAEAAPVTNEVSDWDTPASADFPSVEDPVSLESLLEEALATPSEMSIPPNPPEDIRPFQRDLEPPAEAAPAITHAPPPHGGRQAAPAVTPERRLAEAEVLLQELDRQPRDAAETPSDFSHTQSTIGSDQRDDTELADDYPDMMRAHGSQRRVYRRSRRHILRKLLVGLFVLLTGLGGYYAYKTYVAPITVSAEALYAGAASLMQQGEYEGAANEWRLFTQRFPAHAECAEAQFQAAFAFFLARPSSDDEAREFNRRAIALFEEFIGENPGHRKAVRAACLIGVLHFRLQQFDLAIEQLRPLCEPARRGDDPEAVLPAIRTLARSYARMGDYVAAEEMYEAAASLERNFTPEVDYFELGNLCIERARIAAESSEKHQLHEQAAAYWNNALRAPGIDPQERERIRTQRNALMERITSAPAEAGTTAAAPEMGGTQPEIETDAAAAPAGDEPVREPSPNEEAQQLLRQGAPSS